MFCLKEYHSYTKDADEQDLHGWLPVQHMQGHETGIMQCPCCAHPDKMMEHLFQCTNSALMLKKETLLIIDIRKKGIAKGVPQAIMEALCSHPFKHTDGSCAPDIGSVSSVTDQSRDTFITKGDFVGAVVDCSPRIRGGSSQTEKRTP